jgi:hypothetical protein
MLNINNWDTQDHSGFFRKGGKEMAEKKEKKSKKEEEKAEEVVSKGNIFNFIEDASKDPKLQKQMTAMIKKKGKGETPKTFMQKFHDLGYLDVRFTDCKKILDIIKGVDPSAWDWSY